MELLYLFTLAVGGTAILLIFNLFLNLKKADNIVAEVVEKEEEIVQKPQKIKETQGKSLKTLKQAMKKQVEISAHLNDKLYMVREFKIRKFMAHYGVSVGASMI